MPKPNTSSPAPRPAPPADEPTPLDTPAPTPIVPDAARLAPGTYGSTADLPAVVERLLLADGPILVVTHAKPDGDAFGSAVALTASLLALDKPARACFVPPLPAALARQPGAELADLYRDGMAIPFEPALIVVVDTGAWSQLGPLAPWVAPRLDRTIVIDHHLSGDLAAPMRLVQPEAAAACEIVAELVERLTRPHDPLGRRATDVAAYKPLPPVVRDALFIGVASDTGWFRFSNTRPLTHELAARLLRMGTDQAGLYQSLEQGERPEKLALLCRAVGNLTMLADGRAAVMVLRPDDFDATGALAEETERLVDIPQVVGSVRAVALVTQQRDRGKALTRISFRSKSPDPLTGEPAVDVAELAERFGGGGHARAAGAKVEAPLDEVLPRIEAVLTAAVA